MTVKRIKSLVFLCFYTGQEHILVFLILFIAIETLIFIKLVWTSSLCYNIIIVHLSLFVAVIVDNLARAQSTSDIGHMTSYRGELKSKVKIINVVYE